MPTPAENLNDVINDWGELQTRLDALDDIKEKVWFLQTVVSRNPFVCYDGRCPIFQDLLDLRGELVSVSFTSPAAIKAANVSERDRKTLWESYHQARYRCDKALQSIMRVATVNKAKDEREKSLHAMRIELVEKLNQSHLPLPVDVKSDIESFLNTQSTAASWDTAKAKIQTKTSAPQAKGSGEDK